MVISMKSPFTSISEALDSLNPFSMGHREKRTGTIIAEHYDPSLHSRTKEWYDHGYQSGVLEAKRIIEDKILRNEMLKYHEEHEIYRYMIITRNRMIDSNPEDYAHHAGKTSGAFALTEKQYETWMQGFYAGFMKAIKDYTDKRRVE